MVEISKRDFLSISAKWLALTVSRLVIRGGASPTVTLAQETSKNQNLEVNNPQYRPGQIEIQTEGEFIELSTDAHIPFLHTLAKNPDINHCLNATIRDLSHIKEPIHFNLADTWKIALQNAYKTPVIQSLNDKDRLMEATHIAAIILPVIFSDRIKSEEEYAQLFPEFPKYANHQEMYNGELKWRMRDYNGGKDSYRHFWHHFYLNIERAYLERYALQKFGSKLAQLIMRSDFAQENISQVLGLGYETMTTFRKDQPDNGFKDKQVAHDLDSNQLGSDFAQQVLAYWDTDNTNLGKLQALSDNIPSDKP